MDVNLSGFAGDELDWPDPLLVEAPDENAFLARIDHLLTQETTWPSLAEAEARLLLGPDMAGVAFDSMRPGTGALWAAQLQAASGHALAPTT